ncbi:MULTISPECIES: GNAT family N-acetyltransferase [Maribellus]|uniref:GNAT family N-acetyltransferase n=1 Tax=Maribellus comscasis TaxID=2681766 RepID=A0A6I6JWS8_9BACT|nr:MULTISPECIES: GNAT family N-acetyltransferase [Maribellus]MCG6188756.1 GNAT family N-acetyltransferase [Maribellus maritimus]QGY44577.1 GNAT family N-acetyltransferase [Maribellus comscasis]
MITAQRTNSGDKDFIDLVSSLDALLSVLDGREHDFYNQFNKIDKIKYVVVAYDDGIPVACGAVKKYDKDTMEVKRMFTHEAYRGRGIASLVLAELEEWAKELAFSKCILETGKRQPEAVRLYKKNGYRQIPNFGQYATMQNSVCFEKHL